METKKYFKRFFAEKEIPFKRWEMEDEEGMTHFINNKVVIEYVKGTAGTMEGREIANILRKIDYKNGDVNHFLKHVANHLINLK